VEDDALGNRAEPLLGERVRALREARGWSQDTVAKRMASKGFSWRQTTVAKTEAADRPVRVNEAVALADLYGVDLDSLVRPDLHPLAQRLQKARSILEQVEHELGEAERRVREMQGVVDLARGRYDALIALSEYAGVQIPEHLLPHVLSVLIRVFPDDEWQQVLVDAGFDPDAVKAAAIDAGSVQKDDPHEGRQEGEHWADWEARLVASRLSPAGVRDGER
jgi:transcriptional regulator with XRE-family HTH domain